MDKHVEGKKINFQLSLDEEIQNLINNQSRPKLFLHSCCGPCSSYVLDYLNKYFSITVFFYNPNIFPYEEYDKRLSEQKKLIDKINNENGFKKSDCGFIFLENIPYDHDSFLEQVSGLETEREGGLRCEKCFEMRLKKTAELAKEKGMDYFCTTLSVSPHKNAFLINKIGEEEQNSVKWLFSDFKKKDGYKKSIEFSKKYDLYRQNYCGCEFSLRSS